MFALATLVTGGVFPGCKNTPTPTPTTANTEAVKTTAEGTLIFQNVLVFDGAQFLPATNVVVQDGKISALGDSIPVPDGATVISGEGKTLLPGLIDAHTHVWSQENLRQALVFGVTTELDMMMDPTFAAEVREKQANGKGKDIADLRSAGNPVTVPGGHGTQFGMPVPTIDSVDKAELFVAARIAEGSDHIKLIYDNGSALRFPPIPTLSKALLAASIAAARKQGKVAVVHIGSQQEAIEAIEAGAHGLAHLWIGSPQPGLVDLLQRQGAFVADTAPILFSLCGDGRGLSLVTDSQLAPFVDPDTDSSLRSAYPILGERPACAAILESLAQLHEAGVPLLASTDAPNPGTAHGISMHSELALLVEAGLPPAAALRAATSSPAKAFGLTDRGRIAPGLRADLLLVHGDVSQDIKATRKIAGVWKLGTPMDRTAYRAEVAKKKAELGKARKAPAPPGMECGLISDCEQGNLKTQFGHGWGPFTDQLRGGKSTISLAQRPKGANKSAGAMSVRGQIVKSHEPFAWAGAMFSPGSEKMIPANLSSKTGISFRAKGDKRTHSIMLFSKSRGMMPAIQPFEVDGKWREYKFSFESFDGLDGQDVNGIFLGATLPVGTFNLLIDDVVLYAKER